MSGSELCTCGHSREAHEHYRPGTDCALCGAASCSAFTLSRYAPAVEDGLQQDFPGRVPAASDGQT